MKHNDRSKKFHDMALGITKAKNPDSLCASSASESSVNPEFAFCLLEITQIHVLFRAADDESIFASRI